PVRAPPRCWSTALPTRWCARERRSPISFVAKRSRNPFDELEQGRPFSRMKIPFVKMHGAGNDYVYVNGFELALSDPASVARAVSPRRKGIGSDGLILIQPSTIAAVRMEMYNADGSRGEM